MYWQFSICLIKILTFKTNEVINMVCKYANGMECTHDSRMNSICNNPGDCEYLEEEGDNMLSIDLNQKAIFFDEHENHKVLANNTAMDNIRAMHMFHKEDGSVDVEFVCRRENENSGTHITVHNVRKCMHIPNMQIIHGDDTMQLVIKEHKPMDLTPMIYEHSDILLHGGRHNNVTADDTFMNDVREMHMVRRGDRMTITFTCQGYPDDRPEYVTVHDVHHVQVQKVYWSNAGFNWED